MSIVITQLSQKHSTRYEITWRKFIHDLKSYDGIELCNDVEHVLKHKDILDTQPYIHCCKHRDKCRHYERTANCMKHISWQRKQELYNTNDKLDMVYVCFLSKIHSIFCHGAAMDTISDNVDKICKYSKYRVYANEYPSDYYSLSPLYPNLKDELSRNKIYPIDESEFDIERG